MPGPVLCALADDAAVGDVLAAGRELAVGRGARLRCLHVTAMPLPPGTAHGYAPGATAANLRVPATRLDGLRREALARAEELLGALGVAEEERTIALGDPYDELLAAAEELDPCLIVTGSRGRGPLTGALLGSVSRYLILEGHWPVMVVRPGTWSRPHDGPVVCGVVEDGDDGVRVARQAAVVAGALGRELVLVNAVGSAAAALAGTGAPIPPAAPDIDASADERLGRIAGELPRDVPVEVVMAEGRPAAVLSTAAERRRAAAVVVGCRGLGALRAALEGSVSLDLVREARRPVVVVPPC